jgi:hypothetical protein
LLGCEALTQSWGHWAGDKGRVAAVATGGWYPAALSDLWSGVLMAVVMSWRNLRQDTVWREEVEAGGQTRSGQNRRQVKGSVAKAVTPQRLGGQLEYNPTLYGLPGLLLGNYPLTEFRTSLSPWASWLRLKRFCVWIWGNWVPTQCGLKLPSHLTPHKSIYGGCICSGCQHLTYVHKNKGIELIKWLKW